MLNTVRSFRYHIFLVALAFFAFVAPVRAQPDLHAVENNIIQRMRKGNILGISIAYIYPDGRTHYISRGSLSTEREQPVTPKTIYEIGSTSKTFTALILARMVRQHIVSLDDPINKFLPKSVHPPSFKGQKITLLDLATHTSGLPRMPSNFSPGDTLNPFADYTVGDLYHFLNQYKLTVSPGSRYTYSNLGYGLLGHLLARAAGKSYEQLLRKYITAPLKMVDTGVTVSKKQSERFAHPDNYGRPVKHWDYAVLKGAGGIRSTAEDMANYIKAQMGLQISNFAVAIKMTHQMRINAGSGGINPVGLPWVQSTKNYTIIWQQGATGGFHCFVGFNKDKRRGVVVLASGKEPIDDIGFHMLDNEEPLKQPKTLKKPETLKQPKTSKQPQSQKKRKIGKPAKLGINILNNYTGTYLTTSGVKYYVFRRDKQLRVQVAGKSSQKVFAKSSHRFFFKSKAAEIQFSNDPGASQKFTIYKNKQKIVAYRKNSRKQKSKKKTTNGNSSLLKQYGGVFKISVGYYITITEEGNQLVAQPTGQQEIPAKRINKNTFSLKSIDAKIKFIKNKKGNFDLMKIYQNGRVYTATRLEN